MKKIILIILLGAFFLISCKKSSSPTNGPTVLPPVTSNDTIVGTWKYIYLAVNTYTVSSYILNGTWIKYNFIDSFQSFNTSGTVGFYNGLSVSTNISDSLPSFLTTLYYQNGLMTDSGTTTAFSVWTGFNSSNTSYQLIGTDSIYFNSGEFLGSYLISNGNPALQERGFKYFFSGDTLKMTSYISIDTLYGVAPYDTVHQNRNYLMKFVKN